MTRKLYVQGDMLIEAVQPLQLTTSPTPTDPDGSTVIGRGEVTGHRHRFALEDRVTMFRDDALARGVPDDLYVGHIHVGSSGARLLHEEHDTITLSPGTYCVRRQREWTSEHVRVVAD